MTQQDTRTVPGNPSTNTSIPWRIQLPIPTTVVIPSSEWDIFCYTHTVYCKNIDRGRKDFAVFLG